MAEDMQWRIIGATSWAGTFHGKDYRNGHRFVIHMRGGKIAELEEYSDTELIADVLGLRT